MKEINCQGFLADLNRNYKTALTIMKHSLTPYDYKMRNSKETKELTEAGKNLFLSQYGLKDSSDFKHYNPIVLRCYFGHLRDTHQSSFCDDVLPTYTKKGIGYSLNAAKFFEIYKQTSQTESFCKEFVQTGGNGCETKITKKIKKSELKGLKYLLTFMLHAPPSFDDYINEKSIGISIHHAKTVPFMSPNEIKLKPGVHHKIVLTPRVTTTDDALSKSDIDKKKCLSIKYDPNPLTIFDHYSQENCFFECQLKHATKMNQCTPWDFPRPFDNGTFCSYKSENNFIKDLHRKLQIYDNSSLQNDCPHCLEECDRIDYEYTVHTSQFPDFCKYPSYEGDAIRDVSNVQGIERYLYRNFIDDIEAYDHELHFSDTCQAYALENIATVDIYVGPTKAVHITQSPRVTFLQLVANLGNYVFMPKSNIYKYN